MPRGLRPRWIPGPYVDCKPDVLCAYEFATVHLTRLRRLRCREANALGVRSAYPLASACRTLPEMVSIAEESGFGVCRLRKKYRDKQKDVP